jgi:aryl-alcohol dehydrogenase-like predicted oxidoreductase
MIATGGAILGLTRLAQRRGLSLTQAALAWLLARSPVMLPIPGTSNLAHLEQNSLAAAIQLSAEEMQAIG